MPQLVSTRFKIITSKKAMLLFWLDQTPSSSYHDLLIFVGSDAYTTEKGVY